MITRFLAAFLLISVLTGTVRANSSFGLDLSLDLAAGLKGGLERGQTVNGIATFYGDWNSRESEDDAAYIEAYASTLQIFGRGPTESFVGDLLTVTNAEGHRSLRLYSSWVEFHQPAISARFGLLLADEEFGFSDVGSHLLNASFGWPIFLSANTLNTGPAFFAAGAGGRLRIKLSEDSSLQIGVYDGDTFDSPEGDPVINQDGLHYRFGGDQGIFSLAEYSLREAFGFRVKLGAWWHTARFADVYADDRGASAILNGTNPRSHRGNGGGYAVLEKALRGDPGAADSIDAYLRFGASPSDRNAISWAFDTGLAWQGLWAGRPQDVAAIGFTHAQHSQGYADAMRDIDPQQAPIDYEQVLELSYRIQLSDTVSLQPDLQYIRQPGGSSAIPDALVALVRAQVAF